MSDAYGKVGFEFADASYFGPYPPGHPCWKSPQEREACSPSWTDNPSLWQSANYEEVPRPPRRRLTYGERPWRPYN